jgi:hypothetical protein
MSERIVTHFKGPGQWYAQARKLQEEHARTHPDERPAPRIEHQPEPSEPRTSEVDSGD